MTDYLIIDVLKVLGVVVIFYAFILLLVNWGIKQPDLESGW